MTVICYWVFAQKYKQQITYVQLSFDSSTSERASPAQLPRSQSLPTNNPHILGRVSLQGQGEKVSSSWLSLK